MVDVIDSGIDREAFARTNVGSRSCSHGCDSEVRGGIDSDIDSEVDSVINHGIDST